MSATKTTIILKDEKDWPKWIEVTMSATREHDLVPYVNPKLLKRNLVVLEAPIRPTPANIRPPQATQPNTRARSTDTTSSTQGTSTIIPSPSIITYKDLDKAERT
jgi:hypothetical protein